MDDCENDQHWCEGLIIEEPGILIHTQQTHQTEAVIFFLSCVFTAGVLDGVHRYETRSLLKHEASFT